MTFDEWYKRKIFKDKYYYGFGKKAWNAARRTDPDKARLIEEYKELLIEARNCYSAHDPRAYREPDTEYFAEEIAFITAYEQEQEDV